VGRVNVCVWGQSKEFVRSTVKGSCTLDRVGTFGSSEAYPSGS